MSKQQVLIERELQSNSKNRIWSIISDTDKLSRWIADEIQEEGKKLHFIWGDLQSNHDSRMATIAKKVKYHYIRLKWTDEEDPNAFLELRMEKSNISDNYVLFITDFAEPDDIDTMEDLWADNLDRLHQFSGL
ncbi:START-like domain-containing protein [Hoylesella timonensis]|uniref:START-like domain-containing protein n=1 Tax=Hoylesella timonensis TaxID=386414 RepID=UPI00336A0F80